MIQLDYLDEHIFQMGWFNHQLVLLALRSNHTLGFPFVLSFEKSDIFNLFGNLQNLDSQPDIVLLEFVTPPKTRWWWQLKYFLFSPLFGEDEPNLTNIFQMD